jgi:hypothetical protein
MYRTGTTTSHSSDTRTHQMQWMLIMQGDIPQSNVSIVERLVIHRDFAEKKGKFKRHILRKKKNQRQIFRKSPNEGFPIGDFNVLPVEETKDKGSSKYNSKNSIGKTFICSICLEPEIHLNMGIKVADTHAKIEVKVLLDSGAMGLFINHTLVQDNGIATQA